MRRILAACAAAAALVGVAAPLTASASPQADRCTPSLDAELYQQRLLIVNDRCDSGPVVRRAVFIEFHELVVYRTEEGMYYSQVNAYELFPSLLETGRAAVRTLGGENPAPVG
ncbi:tyrosinase family oxidase copper chaperone [Actinokineospora sp. NPDC004072]